VERLEEEPERGEPAQPAHQLPGGDLARVPGRLPEDRQSLLDPLPEGFDVTGEDGNQHHEPDPDHGQGQHQHLRMRGPEGDLERRQLR
jgi:hypothetical protein